MWRFSSMSKFDALFHRCWLVPQLIRVTVINTGCHAYRAAAAALFRRSQQKLPPWWCLAHPSATTWSSSHKSVIFTTQVKAWRDHGIFSDLSIQASRYCVFSFSNKESLHEALEPFGIAMRVHNRDGLPTKHSCLHDMLHLFLGAILLHTCQLTYIKGLNILA